MCKKPSKFLLKWIQQQQQQQENKQTKDNTIINYVDI